MGQLTSSCAAALAPATAGACTPRNPPADEAQLAIPNGENRCRPWLPIDDGEFAGDLTGAESGQNPLLSTSRCYDDFEQSPLEPIASVAGISSQKKWLTGFEVMSSGAEYAHGQGLGPKVLHRRAFGAPGNSNIVNVISGPIKMVKV